MELTEISDRIDTKLNSFNEGISADEYEKSLYLSKVQKDMYYTLLQAFENSSVISHVLEPFVKDLSNTTIVVRTPIVLGSQFVEIPTTVEKIIYETVTLGGSSSYNGNVTKVLRTRASEISYDLENPFKKPNKDETIRIIADNSTPTDVVELQAITDIASYNIKYLEKLSPIILENLPDGLTIDGVSSATNTKFNDDMLNKIIDATVILIMQNNVVQKQNV